MISEPVIAVQFRSRPGAGAVAVAWQLKEIYVMIRPVNFFGSDCR